MRGNQFSVDGWLLGLPYCAAQYYTQYLSYLPSILYIQHVYRY